MCREIKGTYALVNAEYFKTLLYKIYHAEESVRVVMFDWRFGNNKLGSPIYRINQQMKSAAKRGLDCRAILQSEKVAEALEQEGWQTKTISKDHLLHMKVVIIDRNTALVGSHNLTESAMSYNAEVSLLTIEKEAVDVLLKGFDELWYY